MKTSNIIGGSNVYPCKGSPLNDQEFVNQIEDYNYIKTIYKNQMFMQSSVHLTAKQAQLLKIEMRCVYAPKDPCWGYIDGQGVRSRCIEGRCPRIKQCNPTYTKEQTDYWTMDEDAKILYGEPRKQKKYYLVDLVSDEEMQRYISNPKGAGIEFPPMQEPELKETETHKNPKGRQLVVIGYEETYFGDADNQISPIWGYVDDSEEAREMVSYRYGSRTERIRKNAVKIGEMSKKLSETKKDKIKKDEKKEESTPVVAKETISTEKKQKYEQTVYDKKGSTHQLTELNNEKIKLIAKNGPVNIVLSNEAEMAYVSSMLSQAEISHDIERNNGSEGVCLWKAQAQKFKLSSNAIMVSSAFLSQGCDLSTELVWEELMQPAIIEELAVSGRDFFSFKNEEGLERWGGRNLYGATHLAIRLEDLRLVESVTGEQKITLVKDSNNYIILSTSSAEQLGTTTEVFWSTLSALKTIEEISEFPKIIAGLILTQNKTGIEIKGIGHMRFDEY